MKKEELITQIEKAFYGAILEDGIGLWEAQGIDDYADEKTMQQLKEKDERKDWKSISYKDLNDCSSSLSFFDAKGMRFHLPSFLIFDLNEEELYKINGFLAPDIVFILGYKLEEDYIKTRFSLLDNEQIKCIVSFLEFKIQKIIKQYQEYSILYESSIDAVKDDHEYKELYKIQSQWKLKL